MDRTVQAFLQVLGAGVISSLLGAGFGGAILSIDPQFLGGVFLISGLRSGISMGAVMGLIIGASVMTVLQAARIVGEALVKKS